jgi:hypothetical protein
MGPKLTEEPPDFSVVQGGPTYEILRKLRLTGDDLDLLHRRLLVIPLIAWLPLLLLVVLFPSANGFFSFLHDVEAHVRFLVALPAFIAAEQIVHVRIRPYVRSFIERNIIVPEDRPRYYSAVNSAIRLRNSVLLELGLLALAFSFGSWLTFRRIALDTSTWYAMPGVSRHLTTAGYWYVFVSVPIVQFFLARWYLRLLIWFRFLWQVSRMNLHLIPIHPDHAAGLGFLGRSSYAFSPVLFAEGALLAGLIATEVLHRGASLLSFKLQVIGVIAFFIFTIMGPLLMFTPKLARAKRQGLAQYGLLAQRYVEGFEQKWVLGAPVVPEELLGASDIQSLADLGNSYGLVREMNFVPFGLQDLSRLIVATAAPLVPLLLTVFSAEELLRRIFKVLF